MIYLASRSWHFTLLNAFFLGANVENYPQQLQTAFLNTSTIFSLKTPYGHIFTHFLQPVQFSGFLKMICLCHKNPVSPITCLGQALTHLPHALQLWIFAQTCPVWTCFSHLIGFILLSYGLQTIALYLSRRLSWGNILQSQCHLP